MAEGRSLAVQLAVAWCEWSEAIDDDAEVVGVCAACKLRLMLLVINEAESWPGRAGGS